MILTVEIVNKTLRFSFFEGADSTSPLDCLSLCTDRTDDEIAAFLSLSGCAKRSVECAVIASVVPAATPTVTSAIAKTFPEAKILAVGHGVRTGLDIRTDFQNELGGDIAANAVGAKTLVAPPFAVVDLGESATVLSFVDGDKCFRGASIMPGIYSAAHALSADCANLPEAGISPDAAAPVLGKNTTDSITGGLVNGFAAMIDGMLERLLDEYGCRDTIRIVVTGKGAQTLAPRLSREVRIEPYLAPLGLLAIYRLNSK